MAMINPGMGWFEIIEVPTNDLNEVTGGKYEYINKSSVMASQLFKNIWIIRYPHPRKVVSEKYLSLNDTSLLC